ncbi:MAG TPA: WHG domain-containing protein, partial [Sphingobacterium sp.]|nr:WHG domain-containing protein [Sphingobacterium sp.]
IEATSIRKIAKEIEFSPTTIYLYYKDKSDIVYALHQEGFNLLRARAAPLMLVDHPFERLKAIGKAYLAFAMEEPDFYEVIFMKKEPIAFLDSHTVACEWEEGDMVFDLLRQTILDCQRHGYFKDINADVMSLQAWSTAHGIASLFVTGHLKKMSNLFIETTVDEKTFLDRTFQVYVSMLEKLK